MTRETRLVVALIAVGMAGTTALYVVADQYRKHAAPAVSAALAATGRTEDASTRAAREVEGFLAARAAARGVCERYPAKLKQAAAALTGTSAGIEGEGLGFGLDVIATYRAERKDAFAKHGMQDADYAAARSAWRSWMSAQPVGDAVWTAAFEARRAEAQRAGLGELESLDDAIK